MIAAEMGVHLNVDYYVAGCELIGDLVCCDRAYSEYYAEQVAVAVKLISDQNPMIQILTAISMGERADRDDMPYRQSSAVHQLSADDHHLPYDHQKVAIHYPNDRQTISI